MRTLERNVRTECIDMHPMDNFASMHATIKGNEKDYKQVQRYAAFVQGIQCIYQCSFMWTQNSFFRQVAVCVTHFVEWREGIGGCLW